MIAAGIILPQHSRSIFSTGRVGRNSNQVTKTLLEEQPDNLIASYLLSSIYIDLGEFDNAINTMLGTQKQNF